MMSAFRTSDIATDDGSVSIDSLDFEGEVEAR